jgi:hypothetical protein
MPDRSRDWFKQAERDLQQAEASLHLSLGQEAWGHVVAKLLRDHNRATALLLTFPPRLFYDLDQDESPPSSHAVRTLLPASFWRPGNQALICAE